MWKPAGKPEHTTLMGGHIPFVEFLFQPQQEPDQFSGGYYGYPQGYYPYGCLPPQNPAIYTYTTISKVSKLPTAASIAASTITVGVKMTREDLLQTAPNVVGAASLVHQHDNLLTFALLYVCSIECVQLCPGKQCYL
ncbi:hypothetical protein BDA96_10G068800 [Sorghum bicolor]|uniref:Uncharacterized protein n=3 Tax=Sorghum bicolor TaxID=4558 RepID=A0A921PZ56_SORBI|nr:hypothetical protein BDA96_10G068800 [Sorghum bicolor]OQU75931.1 hypothetical protein SORBI_3010G057666 [Sorghum bicolor]